MVAGKQSILAGMFALTLSASLALAQTPEQNTYVRLMKSGSEMMKAGDYRAARDSFEQALGYNDLAADGHVGVGIACYKLHDDACAERELTRAVEINPKNPLPFMVLGELYYREDDLETASTYWEKAADLNPSDTNLRARLERIKKEHRTEKDFNREMTSHFLIKYEGREKIEAGRIVLKILEDAYGTLGRSLSYYPDSEIQVILYSGQQFKEVTDAPGWSGGIYDGKIRLPIGGIDHETPGLRNLLYHEYTHAVVRDLTQRCPTWLNEGLAQYFEGKEITARQRESLRRMAQAGKLPQLSSLEGSFMSLSGAQASYAYLFSLSSVRYLIDSFGMYRVKSLLDEFASGVDTGKAIDNAITLSYEEFERGWMRSLE